MKYYETHYEEYIHSLEKYNLHNELINKIESFPKCISNFGNLIIYGPSGIGKYTQVLNILKKYSNNDLKHEKKITCQTEKFQYTYHISDIHYEIDMSLLGCNSKILWYEIFLQIMDIITIKQEKIGIILCKNFHEIHTELLEIFYSYMQHCNNCNSLIKIYFVILTEHISFIQNNIINCCRIINIGRPSIDKYKKINDVCNKSTHLVKDTKEETNKNFISEESCEMEKHNGKNNTLTIENFMNRITYLQKSCDHKKIHNIENINNILDLIDKDSISNIKELKSFSLIKNVHEVPKDIFNIICDNIIHEIIHYNNISFTGFRDIIYDILIYNIDICECLWYILKYFIDNNNLSKQNISNILKKIFIFLKYYNNNYRPIYHLESILFYIIIKIHNIDDVEL